MRLVVLRLVTVIVTVGSIYDATLHHHTHRSTHVDFTTHFGSYFYLYVRFTLHFTRFDFGCCSSFTFLPTFVLVVVRSRFPSPVLRYPTFPTRSTLCPHHVYVYRTHCPRFAFAPLHVYLVGWLFTTAGYLYLRGFPHIRSTFGLHVWFRSYIPAFFTLPHHVVGLVRLFPVTFCTYYYHVPHVTVYLHTGLRFGFPHTPLHGSPAVPIYITGFAVGSPVLPFTTTHTTGLPHTFTFTTHYALPPLVYHGSAHTHTTTPVPLHTHTTLRLHLPPRWCGFTHTWFPV